MSKERKLLKELHDFLFGSEKVSIFGQVQNNPNIVNQEDRFLISTYVLFDELLDSYEVELVDCPYLFEDIRKNYDIADNSYNWSSSLSNDINYYQKQYGDDYFVLVGIHGFGDVRCNYFEFLIKIDVDFITFLSDLDTSRKSVCIDIQENIDGLYYDYVALDFDIFSEAGIYNLYSDIPYIEIYSKHIDTYDNVKQQLIDIIRGSNEKY
jgi:hypothetical protein